jgi:hypothetical protein
VRREGTTGTATGTGDQHVHAFQRNSQRLMRRRLEARAVSIKTTHRICIEAHGIHSTHFHSAGIERRASLHRFKFMRYRHIAADKSELTHPSKGKRHLAGLNFYFHIPRGDSCFV